MTQKEAMGSLRPCQNATVLRRPVKVQMYDHVLSASERGWTETAWLGQSGIRG